jgi:sigma-B regulation protein RsbU (phosphoserine phosphatase)
MNASPASLLIVDDDPVFAHFVQQLVLSLGEGFPCTPRWVATAEEALTSLERNACELVLLDYHLPDTDGLEVLGHIRQLPTGQQPAVIMLTGSGSETVAVEAMKRGAKDYLCKAGLEATPLLRALRNARTQKQLADQLASYNAQMRADLEMARHLQQSLLPDHYPTFPAQAAPGDSALHFVHRFIPAAELAGDFFGAFALSDTVAGVFVCDVMGHGVRSALVTAMLRALLESERLRGMDPGRFLTALNHRLTTLIKPADDPLFATAFYLTADVARGRLRYANAGHPRPLRLQRRAGVASFLPPPPTPGPALGLFANPHYETVEQPLAAGDAILLFTDGLFEVADAATTEDYGRQRLLSAATQNLRLPPDALCDALIEDVRRFAGTTEFADDVCLLDLEVVRLLAESS